ncbi:uncharacterized protein LOC127721708 [Mytilus californianus]|uniref:uncharacterized protein LOC127721708 n=1 Tax=Mytilus californianus TaxID=6549 RepID=UPI0022480118|nr:uncharacterized protein LOC127721708 [Mytilus californianus]
MVFCVAFNCNTGSGQGYGLFTFPKDPDRRKIWIHKVKRQNFVPTEHSRLCAKHFDFDQFVIDARIASSVKFTPKQKRLKANAIPTIFNHNKSGEKTSALGASPGKRKRVRHASRALEKRRRLEIFQGFSGGKVSLDSELTQVLDMSADDVEESESVFLSEVEPHNLDTSMPLAVTCLTDKRQTFEMFSQTDNKIVYPQQHAQIQAIIPMTDSSTQTENIFIPPELFGSNASSQLETVEEELSDSDDPEWVPSDEEDEIDRLVDINEQKNEAKERKFIVFETELNDLFRECVECRKTLTSEEIVKKVTGTLIQININCDCGYSKSWKSQPMSNTMPVGNLVLAGAILFSGSNPSKAFNFMNHAGVQFFSLRTYNYMQTAYLVPAVNSVWNRKQLELVDEIKDSGRSLKLGGDARCCSPGHTAKYGSYSVMDLTTSKVIDMQLVQSNEVTNNYAMEQEGLIRCLNFLHNQHVQVSHLITDRHSQVKKFMREKEPSIQHMFDVWHVAKGIYKKLELKGKSLKKGYQGIARWSRSISNHMYWCAASSNGNGEELVQKWQSVLKHCANVHDGHGDLFPNCLHGPLEDREWIKMGSPAYVELEKVICGRMLLKDIKKLSPAEQTSGLESFHNIVCYFAPKSTHFFYWQMRAILF